MESGSSPATSPVPDATVGAGFVRLTRFTIDPGRRGELVEAARSILAPVPATGVPEYTLLVALDDGDWLEISVTAMDAEPAGDAAYLDLAEGIAGDEDGTIIAFGTPRAAGD